MLKRKPRTPSYRRHKATGLGVVTLGQRDFYLGRFGTKASKAEYDRLLGEWLAAGRCLPTHAPGEGVTVVEIIAAYILHAMEYYRRPDGTPTSEVTSVKAAMKPLKRLYGRTPALSFGPLALESVRRTMIEDGLSRGTVNQRIGYIKRMFKWAAGKEIIPAEIFNSLACVAGLRAGRSDARETEPITPVAQADIDAIKSHVSRQVWGMIELQRLTASRPGEIVIMRAADLSPLGKVWLFRPTMHKSSWRGHRREIFIGPRGQRILKPFLADRPVDAFVFSPKQSERERYDACDTHRRKNQKRSKPQTERTLGKRYNVGSYRRAIHRACDAVGIPRWSPHRLRHSSATMLRREFGLEAAQVILGHHRASMTEVYAVANRDRAVQVISKVG